MSDNLKNLMRYSFKKTLPTEKPKCPLAGAGASLTYNSFASACMARQLKINTLNAICINCKKGKMIVEGKRCVPPKGITIIEAKGWKEQPIQYPTQEQWNRSHDRFKHNFAIQPIGAIKKFNIAEKEGCMITIKNLRRFRFKDFETWDDGKYFYVKRVEREV